MKYEDLSGVRIPKIGFGTWSIGGKSVADPSSDAKSLAACDDGRINHFELQRSSPTVIEELMGKNNPPVGANGKTADHFKGCASTFEVRGCD